MIKRIKLNQNRPAFSMLMALFVIVIMSAVAALIITMSGKVVKNTTTQYRDEQARLLAKSYTELAVMSVMAHDRNISGNKTCVKEIQGTINTLKIGNPNPTGGNAANMGYVVETKIQYIGNNLPTHSSCELLTNIAINNPDADSPTMIIDVFIRYKDPDYLESNVNLIPYITYHRRTLQKL